MDSQPTPETKDIIKEVLRSSDTALKVENIRKELGVGNWNSVLRRCLELNMNGEIEGKRTEGGWVFWLEGDGDE